MTLAFSDKGINEEERIEIICDITRCDPNLWASTVLWLEASCPVQGYSSSIRHTRKQHTAASNINPASFISHTTRKLKDLSLSLSFFFCLSHPYTCIFSCPS